MSVLAATLTALTVHLTLDTSVYVRLQTSAWQRLLGRLWPLTVPLTSVRCLPLQRMLESLSPATSFGDVCTTFAGDVCRYNVRWRCLSLRRPLEMFIRAASVGNYRTVFLSQSVYECEGFMQRPWDNFQRMEQDRERCSQS